MKKNCFGISILMSGWCCTHSSKIIWHKYTWLRIPASKWFERPKNIRLASDINGMQKLVITHLRFLGCTHILADRWNRHLSRSRPKEGRPPSGDSVRTQFGAARLVCLKTGWWFGSFFSIYWECHNPNWRTPSFFRGVGIPPTRRWWRSQKGVISTENMVMKGCPIFRQTPFGCWMPGKLPGVLVQDLLKGANQKAVASRCGQMEWLVGGLEHEFYDFPYIGNHNPHWLPSGNLLHSYWKWP